jgi:hypothetical protein
MDVALSTVLIILGVLPGIVFWSSYLSGRFSRQVFGASTVSELARYVTLAVPINVLALHLVGDNPRMVKLTTVLAFVTGKAGENMAAAAADLHASWWFTLLAYLVLLAVCYVGGSFARRLVWALRLDTRFRVLRMKNDWYYLLQGRAWRNPRQVFPYADVLVSHPGEGSRLYRGLISSFQPTETGAIKELVLKDAERGKGRDKDFEWRKIPGDGLVLPGPSIHSINMRFVFVAPPKQRRERFKYELVAFARSFFFEEP